MKPVRRRDDGTEYVRVEDDEAEMRLWLPSLRAMARSETYEEYRALMDQYTKDIVDSVEEVFDESGQ